MLTARAGVCSAAAARCEKDGGGQRRFGPDGYLYIGTGDGGSGNNPPCNSQNDNSPLGKLYESTWIRT